MSIRLIVFAIPQVPIPHKALILLITVLLSLVSATGDESLLREKPIGINKCLYFIIAVHKFNSGYFIIQSVV